MTEQAETDIVERIHDRATSLEQQAADLEDFREDIETKADQVDRMGSREKDAFYANAESLRDEIDTIDSVDEILELEDRIEELIRSPLREAALGELDTFIKAVDVELSSDTEDEVREKVGDKIPKDLESVTESYQVLTPMVQDLPLFLVTRVQVAVEEKPSLLTDPGDDLATLLEQLNARQETLKTVDDALAETGDWTPDLTLSDQEDLYDDLGYVPATGQLTKQISDIDDRIVDIEDNGLQVSELVNGELERELTGVDPKSLSEPFSSVNGDLYGLDSAYERVSEWVSALEAFGTDRGVFESEIDELLAGHEQLKIKEFDSVEALRQRSQSLKEELSSFAERLTEELRVKRQMMEDVLGVLDDATRPEIDIPKDNTGLITQQSVRRNLEEALNSLVKLDDWFQDAFSKLDGTLDSDNAYDIWEELYDGNPVPLTAENEETILALADQFSIRVVLGSE